MAGVLLTQEHAGSSAMLPGVDRFGKHAFGHTHTHTHTHAVASVHMSGHRLRRFANQ